MSEAANPYAPPAARVEDIAANPQAEAVRRAHINQEASIKAVGLLYYLGGVGVTIAAVTALLGVMREARGPAVVLLLLALGVVQLFAGYGVRALRRWGRTLGAILSAFGLLGFPVGTLVNAYILYLFFSKKGRTLFSPEYQEIIAATPDVKYRTSIAVWIVLALLFGLIVFGVYMARFGR